LLVQSLKDVTVVTFQDSVLVDAQVIEKVGQELNVLVEKQDRRKLLLDMSKVTHLSSAALSVLLVLRQHVEKAKGILVISGLNKDLQKLFKLTSLHKIFTFAASEQEALEKMGVILA
jgi:anti-anti-sigma factor